MKCIERSPRFWIALTIAAVASTVSCAEAQTPSLAAARKMLAARDYAGCLREIDALLRGRDGDHDTYLTRGLCAAGRGDQVSAISNYTRAIVLSPRSRQAHYYRGVARSQTGDIRAGMTDFDAAIAIDPSYAAAYGGRAAARRLTGDDSGALADLTQAVQLDPQSAPLRHARGCLLYDEAEWDSAAGDFQQAIAMRGTRELEAFLQRPSLAIGDWERRILEFLLARRSEEELFSGVVDSEPSVTMGRQLQANFYAGSVRLLRGDRDGARRLFEAAVAIDRRSFAEHLSAGAELKRLEAQ
jgi:lipoprotein NlpI